MMNWKQELDALTESTMAFVREIRHQPTPDLPVAIPAEQAPPTDTPKPVDQRATIVPTVWATSQRDEVRQRVSSFKAHQEKITREREDYYLQMKTKMLAPVDPDPALVRPKQNPPA